MIRPIQYLRALAALMIVWVHAPYVVPGVAQRLGAPAFGASGVDLFFLISGFIMVVTTSRNDSTPLKFFTLRIIRVVPLYWLATLAVAAFAAHAPFEHTFQSPIPPAAVAKSLLFIPFAWAGYPGSVWPILPAGWTLNYEMFFYALFALSLAAPRSFRLAGLAAILGSLVIIGKLFGPFAGTFARFYTSPLLLEFVLGMILAHLWLREDGRHRLPLPASVLLMVLGFCGLAATGSRLPVLGGALLLVAGSLHPRLCAIRNRPLLALGDASYSIYLTHQFVLAAVAWTWMRLFPLVTRASCLLFVASALVLCAAAGWLCYRLIERPLTFSLRRWAKRWARASDDEERRFGLHPHAPAGLRDR